MRQFFRENGLSIIVFGLSFLFLLGQSLTGCWAYNEDLVGHGKAALSYGRFLWSGVFIETVFENWESEFLQMGLYVVLTSFLFQKGSAESKPIGESVAVDRVPKRFRTRKRRLRNWLYKHSLSLALLALFAFSFVLHAVGGARRDREEHWMAGKVSFMTALEYVRTSRFWFESFQNWQSEFLSIGALVVLSIFLREKGSPTSKPLGTANDQEAA